MGFGQCVCLRGSQTLRMLSQWLGSAGVGVPGQVCAGGVKLGGVSTWLVFRVMGRRGHLGNWCAYHGALGPAGVHTAMKAMPALQDGLEGMLALGPSGRK